MRHTTLSLPPVTIPQRHNHTHIPIHSPRLYPYCHLSRHRHRVPATIDPRPWSFSSPIDTTSSIARARGYSPISPIEPTTAGRPPHRRTPPPDRPPLSSNRHGEPPAALRLNSKPPSPRATPRLFTCQPTMVGQPDFTGELPTSGWGGSPPLFSPGGSKQPNGLGRVGPDSISEWAGLVGRRKASPAVQFGRGPHPTQEAGFIKILFSEFILVFHNSEVFQKM
jgi:hypothetical protein